jgi:CubicO group peptidase (beta-lactamase class C family)
MADVDVKRPIPRGMVEGYCHPDWRPVLDAFVENFNQSREVGASLCINICGVKKVDLWGGLLSESTEHPWTRDTVSVVFSSTKGATATCAHVLASRGLLDLNAPVTKYWPEFAQAGKENATVSMMLNHSVGVTGFREPLKPGAFFDWGYMVRRIEQEAPFWEPGQRCGYHPYTFGWLVGELVRRISGKSLGEFFRTEIADPLGIDFWIGLPEQFESRVALNIPYQWTPADPLMGDWHLALLRDPTAAGSSPEFRSQFATGGYLGDGWKVDAESGRYVPDTRQAHAAEIGAAGGITNARGLAGLFSPLANGGASLVSRDHVWRMSQTSMVTMVDPIIYIPLRWALGYLKSVDNRHRRLGEIASIIIGDRAFATVGAGGSVGFADPDSGLSFGYTMNRMGAGVLLDQRQQSLIDTTYRVLGYRSNNSGVWVR